MDVIETQTLIHGRFNAKCEYVLLPYACIKGCNTKNVTTFFIINSKV